MCYRLSVSFSQRSYETDALFYVLEPGRNRFRSVLPLVVSEITRSNYQKALIVGAVAEIAWTGIIMHDDIIDHDNFRRGKVAAHQQFSLNSALCSAEVGILDGVEILARSGIPEEIIPFCSAVSRTYRGQILHQRITKNSSEEDLMSVYGLKTALSVWAVPAAASNANKHILIEISRTLGETGQIKDDLDDLFADGSYEVSMRDLCEGVWNLPWLLFYHKASTDDVGLVDKYFGNKGGIPPRGEIIGLLRRYGIVQDLIEYSRRRILRVISLIEELPDSEGKAILRAWAESHALEHYKG